MSVRIERQELHRCIEDNEIIARLLPPEAKPLDIEQLALFHASLGLEEVPNSVLMSREDSDL